MAENIALESTITVNMWQSVLDAFREVGETSFMDTVAFGMRIPDNTAWSSAVNCVHDALAELDNLYHANQMNNEGGFHYEKTGEQSATVICDTEFPCDFNYGILYGIIRKFRNETSSQIVVRREQTPQQGGNTYHLVW